MDLLIIINYFLKINIDSMKLMGLLLYGGNAGEGRSTYFLFF